MSNILIIGKDSPDNREFCEAVASTGRKIFTIAKTEKDATAFESENIFSTTWNKSSAVSAHSVLIQAETKLETMDEVLFYFDTNYFCSLFELDKTEEISTAVDTMINSFLFSTNELLKRIEQRKEKILVSFLLREYPSKLELLSSKNSGILPASSIVSAAQQSFISIAEQFSTNVIGREYLSVMLAKCNNTNELYSNEKAIAQWITSSFEAVKQQKNPQNLKQSSNWNKVGSKVQTGFSLFK